LREAQAVPGKGIKIGRRDFSAVTTDIRVTHVVHENHDDVGSLGHGGIRRNWQTPAEHKEQESGEKGFAAVELKFHGARIS
jgi:hypothetical protein